MGERWLRLREVAERMGLKYESLLVLRCRGKITVPLSKRDGIIGICESDFVNWLRGGDKAA